MNSYNENLRNSVVVLLQSQELEKKKIEGQRSASMLTLYYAEGATITASERLGAAQQELRFKGKVRRQAVKGGNVSNNLLLAENQANQYLKQSVTNASVAASNVQIAATAILKLASDLGGIFSIVNAADYHTDIYKQAKAARDYMNDTAYAAEYASQLAMETTMLTSEVSFPTVLDDAKSMNTQMNNLLKIISGDYDATAQTVTNDNALVAASSADEKKAEGSLEDISVAYQATCAAYNAANRNLNLNLTSVAGQPEPTETSLTPENRTTVKMLKGTKSSYFTVAFNCFKSPFEQPNESQRDPVEYYRIIIVKDSNKTTFDLSAAESLLTANNLSQCIPIGPDIIDPMQTGIIQSFNIYKGLNGRLLDSDGKNIEIGTNYVIFVMAVLTNDYKKKINNFDDYLSAPSASFCLTTVLQRAQGLQAKLENNTITFHVDNNQESSNYKIEYRCMLLPLAAEENPSPQKLIQSILEIVNVNLSGNEQALEELLQRIRSGNITEREIIKRLVEIIVDDNIALPEIDLQIIQLLDGRKSGLAPKEMLTTKLLSRLDQEVNELQLISNQYDPKIALAEQALIDAAPELQNMADEDINPFEKIEDGHNELLRVAKELQHHYEQDQESPAFKNALATLEKLVAEKKAALQKVQADINTDASTTTTPPFFFNLEIAEQIPMGDYIVADQLYTNSPQTKGKNNTDQPDTTFWEFGFGNNTNDEQPRLLTDNFGNLLVDQKEYLPVVLSFAAEPGAMPGQFENKLSQIQLADKFTFKNLSL